MTRSSHIWHPYTKFSAVEAGLPMITRGEGLYLYDDQGNRYLDAVASWWCCNLGHSHPRLVQAIQQQAGVLQHSILGNLNHPGADQLAQALSQLMPTPDRHVLFASDGSSAVEAALKIAVQYFYNRGEPQRNRFLTLSDPYHGDTLGAVSIGYMESFHRPFRELVFKAYHTPAPACRAVHADDEVQTCRAHCCRHILDQMETHRDVLAGVVLEPLCQGAAGMRMYAPSFITNVAERCREMGLLLIMDEIAMGFGRTGKMFAFEHAAVDPDLVTMGKGITGGTLPLSATVVRDEIYQTFSDTPEDHTFYHGHTFGGNPIACAAALETLALYEELDLVDHTVTLAAALEEGMAPLNRHEAVKETRCLGLIGAVEFLPAYPDFATGVRRRLLDMGILARPLGNVMYLMPPLVIEENTLQHLVASLDEAIGENRPESRSGCAKGG